MRAVLLTAPFQTLPLADRARSLELAREAGRVAAGGPVDPQELESGRPYEYYIHVVAPLLEGDGLSPKAAAGWKLRCLDHRALEDPRVQAFLFGWHERALELLGEVEAGGHADAETRVILERLEI